MNICNYNHLKALAKKILPPIFFANAKRLITMLFLIVGHNRGYTFARDWKRSSPPNVHSETAHQKSQESLNPLWTYFINHTEGHGIWKWEHYFDVYHRHLSKFVGTPVNILEIGIYSGGSLGMWRSYFGKECHIYGIDIDEACKTYESENISVLIGDQEDQDFWAQFKKQEREIDILIDDGGHTPNQQMVTLEQMLPYLRPGGVYICEDVQHGLNSRFTAFASGLVTELNTITWGNNGVIPTPFQTAYHSIHFYPYIVVIEKHLNAPRFLSTKRGTRWQPFLS